MAEPPNTDPPLVCLRQTRLYLLTGEYPPRAGGIADYTAQLAWHLKALALNVRVLVGSDHPYSGKTDAGAPLPATRLDCRLEGWRLLPTIARLLRERPGV